jgi:hypothetical protein
MLNYINQQKKRSFLRAQNYLTLKNWHLFCTREKKKQKKIL